jgi:diguanylate cyclase (GGDEF)-like protein
LDQGAKILQLIFVLSLLLTPLLGYARIIVPLTFMIMACVVFMLILGTASVISGSRPARYYLLAWGFFLAGSIVFLLKMFGTLPHTFFTHHGWQLGSLVEMVLLSMTLSSRMNELKHMSHTDSLTLLGNRRLFDDTLPNELTAAIDAGRPLSLLVLDIDHFKAYNDRHGHVRGDEAIKMVADTLRRYTPKPFTACRFGGEEFTVILPGKDEADAVKLAERLRVSVQDSLQGDLAITISVGYASLSQARFETAEKMFEAADFALYSAKQAGRNRVMGFRERRKEDVARRA